MASPSSLLHACDSSCKNGIAKRSSHYSRVPPFTTIELMSIPPSLKCHVFLSWPCKPMFAVADSFGHDRYRYNNNNTEEEGKEAVSSVSSNKQSDHGTIVAFRKGSVRVQDAGISQSFCSLVAGVAPCSSFALTT
jgi:hypothetical protein